MPTTHFYSQHNVQYQVMHTTLFPGLLKTFGFQLPSQPDSNDTSIVCRVHQSHFHGLVDRIMSLMEVAPDPIYADAVALRSNEETFPVSREGCFYTIATLNAKTDNDGLKLFGFRHIQRIGFRGTNLIPLTIGIYTT